MNIVYFEPGHGGHREWYYQHVLNGLAYALPSHATIVFAAPARLALACLDARIHYYQLPTSLADYPPGPLRQAAYLRNFLAALAVARAIQATIFHHGDIDAAKGLTVCALAMFRPQLPVMGTLHWGQQYISRLSLVNRLYQAIDNLVFTALMTRVQAIIVHGPGIKQIVDARLNAHLRQRVVSLPYPAVGGSGAVLDQASARSELGLPQNVPLFLAFGATRYDKGIDLALAALDHADDATPWKLVVAGMPDHFGISYFSRWQQENPHVQDRLVLLPRYFQGRDTDLVFSACDAVVLPYRKVFSGQSGILLQAVQYEKPVISADVAQLGLDVTTYQLGLTFPAEDVRGLTEAIRAFLKHQRTHTERLHKSAQDYVHQNSLETMVQKVLQAYQTYSSIS
jgi:glycosyltransferase involved in cell wall biosynthesis